MLNKTDRADPVEVAAEAARFDAVPVSAIDRASLAPLVARIQDILWREAPSLRAAEAIRAWSSDRPN